MYNYYIFNRFFIHRRRISQCARSTSGGLDRALDRDCLQDDPVLLLLVSGARLHGIQLAKVDDNTVLRRVSDVYARLP